MFALPRIREIIECCCSRLGACRVMFEAETPDAIDLPFDQGNAIDAVIRDVRKRLLDECVEPIARICRTRDRWLDKEAVERISVHCDLTRAQVYALTGIVRELSKLNGENLESIYRDMDAGRVVTIDGSKAVRGESHDA